MKMLQATLRFVDYFDFIKDTGKCKTKNTISWSNEEFY